MTRLNMRHFLALPPLAGLLLLAVPGTAQAAVYTSSGVKCTIVGTSGNDWLEGTDGHDVICGRGGDDKIYGLGGADTLDGGAGDDWLYGGDKVDLLLGGPGDDNLSGGTDEDTLDGGWGADVLKGDAGHYDTVTYADRTGAVVADIDGVADDGAKGEGDLIATSVENITGGAGADRLTGSDKANNLDGGAGDDRLFGRGGKDWLEGGAGRNTMYGGDGDDTLAANGVGRAVMRGDAGADSLWGTAGDDDMSGGPGDDNLSGYTGDDLLDGGAGTDDLNGGDGDDTLTGGDGDDDIHGDAGADQVDGGAGANWCILDDADAATSCPADAGGPVIADVSITPSTVDVSAASAEVRIRARVTDDVSGVKEVRARIYGEFPATWRTSGTIRDGVWDAKVIVPRFAAPGSFALTVDARDRLDNPGSWSASAPSLTVTDANPDTQQAEAVGVTVDKKSVDVRAATATVTVTARLTDKGGSGVAGAAARLYVPNANGVYAQTTYGTYMEQISGNGSDGLWRAKLTVPKRAMGGEWGVGLRVSDRVHSEAATFVGENVYREAMDRNDYYVGRKMAGGAFTVISTTTANGPVKLTGMTADLTAVSALTADQTAHVRVHAVDPAGAATWVRTHLVGLDGATSPYDYALTGALVEGTAQDGWWEIAVTFPKGTAPGRYALETVQVDDATHQRQYVPAGSPAVAWWEPLLFPAGTVKTTAGASWDGVFTVS